MSSLIKFESYKRGAIYSSFFSVVSRGMAFLANILIAYYFGTNSSTDVYFFLFSLVTLISSFFISLNSSVIIPESMRLNEIEGKGACFEFLNMFFYGFLLLSGILALAIIAYPIKVMSLLSHFDNNVLASNTQLILLLSVLIPLLVLTTFVTDILSSHKYFTLPMIASVVMNIVVISAVVLLHNRVGVMAMGIGLLVGNFIWLMFLLYVLKKIGWSFSKISLKLPKKVAINIGYSQLGNITTVVSAYVPLLILSGFSAGVVSSLNYGQKTAEIPTQLITMQISSIIAIKFNELFAKKEHSLVGSSFVKNLGLLTFILFFVSAIISLNSSEIIQLLYKRGKFETTSLKLTSDFLGLFCLALPFFAVNTIFARLFMASQNMKYAFWYQMIMNLCFIGLIILCIHYLGMIGYPIAYILIYLANAFLLYFIAKNLYPYIDYGSYLIKMTKLIIVHGSILFMLSQLKQFFLIVNPVLNIVVMTALYLIIGVIILVNLGFKQELAEIKNSFQVLNKKKLIENENY